MANETGSDFSGAVSNLIDTAGKLVQEGADLVGTGAKTAISIVEPLAKSALDLVGSIANTAGQVLQNVTSAIAPKK